MSSEKQHPFLELSELIAKYKKGKASFDVKELQTIREDISLCLFYLSDSASEALSRYDHAEHARKSKAAEREQYYRNDVGSDGKSMTVSEAQNLARIDCKKEVDESKEALRQKERVRIILSSTTNILHAISSRLNIIQK